MRKLLLLVGNLLNPYKVAIVKLIQHNIKAFKVIIVMVSKNPPSQKIFFSNENVKSNKGHAIIFTLEAPDVDTMLRKEIFPSRD